MLREHNLPVPIDNIQNDCYNIYKVDGNLCRIWLILHNCGFLRLATGEYIQVKTAVNGGVVCIGCDDKYLQEEMLVHTVTFTV